jgi:hypothetical protein
MKGCSMEAIRIWLSPQDLAKPSPVGLGISESTQAKLRMKGEIPFSKISNKFIRYDSRQIDKWLEDHAVVSV